MKRQLLTLILVLITVLCSCSSSRTARNHAEESATETGPRETSEYTQNANSELHVWIIDAAYGKLGEYSGIPSLEENYIEKALHSYAQKNFIDIQIQYAYHQGSIVGKADLIILGPGADLQHHLSNEKYLDLTSYFEQEQIYSSGQYVEPVLQAGIHNDQQLAFPLIFNMYAIYTSEESLARHQLELTPEDSFDDIVSTLTSELNNLSRPTDEILLMGFESIPSFSSVFQFFHFASGTPLTDPETEDIALDPAYFENVLALYEAYIYNNFNSDRSSLSQLSDNPSFDYSSSDQSKWYRYSVASSPSTDNSFIDIADQIACLIDIDPTFDPCKFSSFIAQAAYYESRYRDLNETFMCIGIPEQHGGSYAAQVTLCGLIPANSRHPDESCQLLKYLADTSVPWYLGASVNRDSISDILQYLTETTIELPSYESEPYCMQPMSQGTATYLQQVIEQVHTAYLPMHSLRTLMDDRFISYMTTPSMTLDDLYEKIRQAISLYLFQE